MKEHNREWWKLVWHCWKAVNRQAREWRCSRLYVVVIAVSDMLKVDYPVREEP